MDTVFAHKRNLAAISLVGGLNRHLMVFTQCSILNPDSPDVNKNRIQIVRQRTEGLELHLGG